MNGQIGTRILDTKTATVRLCYDILTDSYSIGVSTEKDFQWKFISRELHDLLVKELSKQEGNSI